MHHYLVLGQIDGATSEPFQVSGNNEKLVSICANCNNKRLEYHGRVGEAEVHNAWLERSAVSDKGYFPLIFFLNPDIVIASPDIEFSKNLGFS